MSLAMYSSPINDDNINNNNYINKKKSAHNKTQKQNQLSNYNSKKVNSVLNQIHNNSEFMDDNVDDSNMGDYIFPPKPESSSANKLNRHNNIESFTSDNISPQYDANMDLNNIKTVYEDEQLKERYYNNTHSQIYNTNNTNNTNSAVNNNKYVQVNNEQLLQKMNYMIQLLENNTSEKTNNVTEEIILYSFLGIFMIFIVDSFSKTGKYVR
jgi:hypothetical protein